MNNLPKHTPTVPHGRRYTREFTPGVNYEYGEGSDIMIEIPPIARSYLTKDVRLMIETNLEYLEDSQENAAALQKILYEAQKAEGDTYVPSTYFQTNYEFLANLYGYEVTNDTNSTLSTASANPIWAFRKPLPSFDINGPHGLISDIKVYDYRGTTLLEHIPAHDVLTAQFADNWWKEENVLLGRPDFSDNNPVYSTTTDRRSPGSNVFTSYAEYSALVQAPPSNTISSGGGGSAYTSLVYPPSGLTSNNSVQTNGTYANGSYKVNNSLNRSDAYTAFDINDTPYTFGQGYSTANTDAGTADGAYSTSYIPLQSTTSNTGATYYGSWLELQLPTSIIFDYATIKVPADASNKFRVMSATIFGSNDSTNDKSWQVLGSINVNSIPSTDTSTLTKDTGSTTAYYAQAYKTFRIVINKVVGGGLTNSVISVNNIDIFGFQTSTPTLQPVTIKQTYTLDLVSFLGNLSKSFVPLHNGYRLQLRVNNPNNCISFSTIYGDNRVYFTSNNTNTVSIDSYIVQPKITKFSLKNVRLSANILEVSPHLDGKISKTVHTLGFKYQNDPLENMIKRRILPELKSLNKVYLAMRRRTKSAYDQFLGFRLANNLKTSRLSYNDAVVREYTSKGDMYKGVVGAMEERFARYIDYDDYTTALPNTNGTKGCQALVMALPFWRDCYVTGPGTYPWFFPTTRYTEDGVLIVNTTLPLLVTPINSYFAGKFLIGYDCRLPGAEDGQITGIDTSKHVLTYEMISESDGFSDTLAMVDVFMEHDAFVHVDPGKSTAVSF